MSELTLDTVVAMEIEKVGFYAYPELITLFKAIFTNSATKEQIDYADKITKPKGMKKRLAKAYDNVQEWLLKANLKLDNGSK